MFSVYPLALGLTFALCVIYSYLCMVANTKCPVDIHATTKLDLSGILKNGFLLSPFWESCSSWLKLPFLCLFFFFLFSVLRPSFYHLFLVKLFWLTSCSGFLWCHCGGLAFPSELPNTSFFHCTIRVFSLIFFFPQTINLFTSCNYIWFTL